jgi:DNA-binding IclR family transcriptional regulator
LTDPPVSRNAERHATVASIERALAILEALAASRKGLTLSQLARSLDLARSSAYYILNTLEQCGYICRSSAGRRYTFTTKLFDLAGRSLNELGIREYAAPLLHAIMEKTGLTVHLAAISQNELVIIDKVSPPGTLQLATWVGKRLPLHCTGAGKSLLAYLADEQVERHIKHGLTRYNDNTIATGARLRGELSRVRRNGFAVDDEEETIGLRCIGAPVFDANHVIAAISIAGTTAQINEENIDSLSSLVMTTAANITATLRRKIG